MSQFPLYMSLLKDIPKVDLKTTEKREFIRTVKKMDQYGYDLIYALIKVYYTDKAENISNFTLPYNGKFVKNDIKFELDMLPFVLKQILNKFVHLHINNMNETKNE